MMASWHCCGGRLFSLQSTSIATALFLLKCEIAPSYWKQVWGLQKVRSFFLFFNLNFFDNSVLLWHPVCVYIYIYIYLYVYLYIYDEANSRVRYKATINRKFIVACHYNQKVSGRVCVIHQLQLNTVITSWSPWSPYKVFNLGHGIINLSQPDV